MQKIFHGSSISDLKVLKPKEAGHKESYVYATTKHALACVFCANPRSSLEFRLGEDENEEIVFCEKFEGVFDKYYKNLKASLYILNSEDFKSLPNLHPREVVSDNKVTILDEIVIQDMKDYLLNLEEEGLFTFVPYKERLQYFPEIDNELESKTLSLIAKYGKEKTEKNIKKINKDLWEKVKHLF